MDRDEFVALAEDESREATRRAAHLTMLLAVEGDGAEFQRQVQTLAIGDDADPAFVAQVAAVAVQIAAKAFEPYPVEARREFLMTLIGNTSTFNIADLDPPEDPS